MSDVIKCDGCGEIIDTEREQWIEIQVSQEKKGMIGKNNDSFPVEEKTLHFHSKDLDHLDTSKNCLADEISETSLYSKVKA